MRRVRRLALLGVLGVLPFVLAAGHPVLSAMLVQDRPSPGRFGGLTPGVNGHIGVLHGLDVTQRHYLLDGPWCARVTRTGRNVKSDRIPLHVSFAHGFDSRYEQSLATWSPGLEGLDPGGWDTSVMTVAYGWPWASAAVDYGPYSLDNMLGGSIPHSGAPINGVSLSMSALVVNRFYAFERRVPTRVVWGGMPKNLAVYGAVCWCGVVVPWAVRARVRRALRRRHGLCASCGYEVGALDVCPECGAERDARGGGVGPASAAQ